MEFKRDKITDEFMRGVSKALDRQERRERTEKAKGAMKAVPCIECKSTDIGKYTRDGEKEANSVTCNNCGNTVEGTVLYWNTENTFVPAVEWKEATNGYGFLEQADWMPPGTGTVLIAKSDPDGKASGYADVKFVVATSDREKLKRIAEAMFAAGVDRCRLEGLRDLENK